MTVFSRLRRLVRRRGTRTNRATSNAATQTTTMRNAATQTNRTNKRTRTFVNNNLTNQQRFNLLKAYNNATPPPSAPKTKKMVTIGDLFATAPGTPNQPPRPYAPPRLSKAPTQNYIAELQKLARSVKHAEGRAKLQVSRIKERPDLAGSLRRAQLNVTRARQITEAVDRQLANALAGRWVEHAISYSGPGRWTFVPGLDALTSRVTGRVAQRNQKLGGRPTLNWYDVKHANQLNRAKAALNALLSGSRAVGQNEVRLLQGQLKRVIDKNRRQGLLFDWERNLLKNKNLIERLNRDRRRNAIPNINNDTVRAIEADLDRVKTKLLSGLPLTKDEQLVLFLEKNITLAAGRNW